MTDTLVPVEQVEQIITAWAFAHNIDGAARNDLFARLRASRPDATIAAAAGVEAEHLLTSAYERGYHDGREDAPNVLHMDAMREGLAQWQADNRAAISALSILPAQSGEGWRPMAEVVAALRHRCEQIGSQGAVASAMGFSATHLSDVLSGRREVSSDLAVQLGFRREPRFLKLPEPPDSEVG